ncbi:sirohydrochlorin cobaltochelatase, putative [Mycobacterium lentiflavum]|uniref:Sirohydrochlorin chelatase n=1 Tax=Mycobacterium lentiflavum TaxID=141349 RepID=A0A0E4CLE0_MYCLN|nr:sirohydrochlorin chelatase [Mycobacterium lentiflavum]MEE3063796.1 sirohydrochlorin chelatase [Actinomycetota bacterium]ULP42887.1 sirohydrochlorin chelatase [Mycobacterium lentiflavum]CQD04322.1 sirohydrochlorin cobaltochelatase, putative [Mycobacterium lentiflavum]
MSLILAAHGTRRPGGVAMIGDLAAQVSRQLGRTVRVAFVDVLGPTPSEVLCAVGGHRAVVVPAFLSRGYHVRADVPAHVAASGHPNAIVTPALGPGGEIARIVADQLMKSGWRLGDSVILGAAGTSDPIARADLHTTATLLSALTGSRVTLGFAAVGDPQITDAVERARADGARRVAIASYLLADGLFQEKLRHCGADLVSEPLGTHPRLARLIANRFRRAVPVATRHPVRRYRPGAPRNAMLDL